MKKPSSSSGTGVLRSGSPGEFVLGRERFAQISAVEGIALTDDLRATRDHLDRQNLSASERRTAIIKRFAPSR